MSKFKAKIGKQVVILPRTNDAVGVSAEFEAMTGVIISERWVVSGPYEDWVQVLFPNDRTFWFPPAMLMAAVKVAKPKLAKVKPAKVKVAKPKLPKMRRIALSSAIGLYPQTRQVLSHLESKGSISPLEAFGVYGITRLAARINELRQAGMDVTTNMRKDAKGTRYASYSLNA